MATDGVKNPTKAKSKGKAKAKGISSKATALHGTDGKNHIVGIGNLRVIICPDGDGWFAQGLEIDYASGGDTIVEVKKNFEKGLEGTINLHLQMYGDIEKFLKAAPEEVWKELYRAGKHFHYSQVSLHEDISRTLLFQGIDYFEPSSGVAA